VVAPLPYQAMCIPVLGLSHSGMCSASSRSGFPVGRYDIAGRAVLTVDDIRLTSHSTRALDSHGELLLLPMKIYTYRRSATAGGSPRGAAAAGAQLSLPLSPSRYPEDPRRPFV
jgi:hypothetical protein